MLAAHRTKHLPLLEFKFSHFTFTLAQSDTVHSTGTTCWLGAQCLAFYLIEHHAKYKGSTAVELGSGIGLTALVLAGLGWSVTATDIEPVLSAVLRQNIANNRIGTIHVRELDWTKSNDLENKADLIVTADTVFAPELVLPLLHTLQDLCTARTTVLLCIERRDPALVDAMLAQAGQYFSVVRVRNLAKAVQKHTDWPTEDWDGVELWRLRLRTSK